MGAEADEGDAELAVAVAPAVWGIRLVVLFERLTELDATGIQGGDQGVWVGDMVLDFDLVGWARGYGHAGSLVDRSKQSEEARWYGLPGSGS